MVETQCLRLFEEVGGRICRNAMFASWMGLAWRGAAVGRDLRLGEVAPSGRWGGGRGFGCRIAAALHRLRNVLRPYGAGGAVP